MPERSAAGIMRPETAFAWGQSMPGVAPGNGAEAGHQIGNEELAVIRSGWGEELHLVPPLASELHQPAPIVRAR